MAAAALFDGSGKVLISRRPDHVHQGGRWEFPGGKLEPGEGVREGLKRELNEELGIDVLTARPLIQVAHDYPERSVLLHVWRVDEWHGEPRGREGQAIEWLAPDELRAEQFPAADVPIIAAIRLPSVYLITPEPESIESPDFIDALRRCLDSGVSLVQLRAKSLNESTYRRLAERALAECEARSARLILNAAPELSAKLGAHGVHLDTRRLMSLEQRPLDAVHWVGASCHDERELTQAENIGVDFVVLSPVMPTKSHPHAQTLGWERFAQLVSEVSMPVYALGGMRALDRDQAWQRGAQGIASMRDVWNEPERLKRL